MPSVFPASAPPSSGGASLAAAYAAAEGLVADPEQAAAVDRLADLQRRLGAAPAPTLLRRILHAGRPIDPVKGIWLWGGVGRGKTMLMDLFFETLPEDAKQRIHFHRMMGDIHRRLAALRDTRDPLDRVAAAVARGTRVLCFDEFFVSDIGDAMLLSGFLGGLFRRGVTLVATSNVPPDGLYAGGLQRERFLPAIELLETYTDVVELDGGTDYRTIAIRESGTWFDAGGEDADDALERCFRRIAPGRTVTGRVLDIAGRPVRTLCEAKGVAWFEFAELCEGPRSQQDYIEIARCYNTVLLSGVPVLTGDHENAARRFVALVDEFYDRRVKLIASAAAPIDRLYRGNRLRFEFQRTESRLLEMQSADYLHAAHRS